MKNGINEADVIDLQELFGVLVRKLWAIILAVLIAAAAAFGYTAFAVEPLYQASVLMYVNNSDISIGSTSFSISNAELMAAQELVDTYIVILQSRMALNEVIEEAELDYDYEELKSMISAKAVSSTEIFEIVVTSTSPSEAEKIANTIANVLPDKIADIVVGSDVRIVDYAVVPSHRYSPSYTRNTAIGALLGAVLSVAIITVTYLFDENIHSEDYLTQYYAEIPLLSVIPDMSSAKQHGKNNGYYAYRQAPGKKKNRRGVKTGHEQKRGN